MSAHARVLHPAFTIRLITFTLLALTPAPGVWAQSGAPSSIAFHSNRDGNNEIYVMDADGSVQQRITTHPANDIRPDISPDGRHIVFASNRSNGHFEIFLMDAADGGDVRQLTSTPATTTNTWPRWSPNGEWIAYQSNVSGAFQIHVMRADGSESRQITPIGTNPPASSQFPDWSPDGTKLAIRGDVDVWVIDVNGASAPARLTSVGPLNQMAVWSPDGTQLAFMSTREPGNYPSVFLMNADGSGQRNLTPKEAGASTWSSRAPSWSPNGKYIYFTAVRDGVTGEQVHVMHADGSSQTRLTTAGVNAEASVRNVSAPQITGISATPDVLWPPNGQATRVIVSSEVTDNSDPAPACGITTVTSNEALLENAWEMRGPLAVDLHASRFGFGSGRIYTLTVVCTNTSGLQSTGTVTVRVPHDRATWRN